MSVSAKGGPAEACVARVASTVGPMLQSGRQETIVIISVESETAYDDHVAIAATEDDMWRGIATVFGQVFADLVKSKRPAPLVCHARVGVVMFRVPLTALTGISVQWAHARLANEGAPS